MSVSVRTGDVVAVFPDGASWTELGQGLTVFDDNDEAIAEYPYGGWQGVWFTDKMK